MKRTRIGLFILSNSWGGAEESVYNIASHLNKNEFEVHLFINEFLKNSYSKIKDVEVHNLGQLESNKKLKKIFSLISIRTQLLKTIKESKVQLIHAQLENTILVIGMSFRKLNIPLVFTLRGDETKIYHSPKTLEQKLIHIILGKILKDRNTTVTSISYWLTKDFDEKYKKEIVVISNGVDCKVFRPLKMKSPNKRKNTILFVGRFVKGKGISDLVKVAKELKECRFLFVGKGPMGKLMKLSNTIDLGFKKREQVVKLYNKATIFTLPSRHEAFGLVALEAMACGKAIVASNLGASDYVESGKDGILIEPGNRFQLKAAIVHLMENNMLREKIEKNARKKALEYDINQTILRYQDLYKKTIVR